MSFKSSRSSVPSPTVERQRDHHPPVTLLRGWAAQTLSPRQWNKGSCFPPSFYSWPNCDVSHSTPALPLLSLCPGQRQRRITLTGVSNYCCFPTDWFCWLWRERTERQSLPQALQHPTSSSRREWKRGGSFAHPRGPRGAGEEKHVFTLIRTRGTTSIIEHLAVKTWLD